jgi:hypothetical protein
MADRYCSNCGNELRKDARFCPNCGEPIHQEARDPTSEADAPEQPPPQPQAEAPEGDAQPPTSNARLLLRLGVILAILAVVGVGVNLLGGGFGSGNLLILSGGLVAITAGLGLLIYMISRSRSSQ